MNFNSTPLTMRSSRLLGLSQTAAVKATKRLSSGLRVTDAASDAAGLVLGTKLQAQFRGWRVAERNIQDGISLLNTAEGAMSELTSVMQRLRELAVQAASGTLTDADRQQTQVEVDLNRGLIGQIVDGTRFNGIDLLRGTVVQPSAIVDVSGVLGVLSGTGGPSTITGSYAVTITQAPRRGTVVGDMPLSTTTGAVTMNVAGASGAATLNFAVGTSPAAMLAAINAQTATTGVEAILTDATTLADDGTLVDPFGDGYLMLRTTSYGSASTVTVSATGATANDNTGFGSAAAFTNGQDVQGSINGAAATTGGSGSSPTLTAGAGSGGAMGLSLTLLVPPPAAYVTGPFPLAVGTVNVTVPAPMIGDLALTIQAGPDFPTNTKSITLKPLSNGAMSLIVGAGTVGGLDISTQAGALAAIDIADAALAQLSEARGQAGADANTLEIAMSVARGNAVEVGASHSRIMDADLAQETQNLVRSQILQQAAQAMLAQVNTMAMSGLSLINAL